MQNRSIKSTKIIFFGTSDFAVPALKKLKDSGFVEIIAVVTQPDKPAGRKQLPLTSPVKKATLELGLKVLQPEILNSTFHIPPADVFVVASYGKMVPSEILRIPRFGVLNIHPSLLPKYRGPSPIQTTILNRDKETGVTIIKLDEEMDHGDIVAYSTFHIPYSIFYKDLHDKLAQVGAELLVQTLSNYIAGNIKPIPQDHQKATFTKIITKQNGRINWSKSAEEIDAQVRALHVWPVAWTTLHGKRLKIFDAASSPSPLAGEGGDEGLLNVKNGAIQVSTARGLLKIKELQLEGGKRLTAKEFANGHLGLVGKILK